MGKNALAFGSQAPGTSTARPADVTVGSGTYSYTNPGSQAAGQATKPILELRVPWLPPDGWTGKGVHNWYEYPDGSMGGADGSAFVLGSTALGADAPVVGEFKPQDGGLTPLPTQVSIIRITDLPTVPVSIRVSCASYNDVVDNVLVRATDPGATPSTVIDVLPPPTFNEGEEYAANVTGLAVDDQYVGVLLGAPGIPSVPGGSRTYYLMNGSGQLGLHFTASWTNPADPNFAALQLMIIRADGIHYPLGDHATKAAYHGTVVNLTNFPGVDEAVIVYSLSVDQRNNLNTYVAGVTPSVALTLHPPTIGTVAGGEHTGLVTGISASVTYGRNGDGVECYGFTAALTPLSQATNPEFGGVKFVLRDEAGIQGDIVLGFSGPKDTVFPTPLWPLSSAEPTWDLYFVSIDINSKENTLVPGFTPRVTGLHPSLQTSGSLQGQRMDPATLDASLGVITGGTVLGVTDLGIITGKIANVAVVTGKLADLATTAAKLADSAVTTVKLDLAAVTTAKLAALAVDASILANSAVTSTKIANLAVGTAAIALLAVDSAQIATAAITSAKIANLAVGTAAIASLAVTDAKINDLAANKITAGTLVAGVVYAGTINCSQLNAGTINVALSITAGTFTGSTLVLNSNGITTTINNATDATIGFASGLKVLNNSASNYSSVVPQGHYVLDTGGLLVAALNLNGIANAGVLSLIDNSGSNNRFIMDVHGATISMGTGISPSTLILDSSSKKITVKSSSTVKTEIFVASFTLTNGSLVGVYNPDTMTVQSAAGGYTALAASDGGSNSAQIQVNPAGAGTGTGLYINSVGVVMKQKTGWGTPTGTPSRATFDTATINTPGLAGIVMALLQDLGLGGSAHSLIGN